MCTMLTEIRNNFNLNTNISTLDINKLLEKNDDYKTQKFSLKKINQKLFKKLF